MKKIIDNKKASIPENLPFLAKEQLINRPDRLSQLPKEILGLVIDKVFCIDDSYQSIPAVSQRLRHCALEHAKHSVKQALFYHVRKRDACDSRARTPPLPQSDWERLRQTNQWFSTILNQRANSADGASASAHVAFSRQQTASLYPLWRRLQQAGTEGIKAHLKLWVQSEPHTICAQTAAVRISEAYDKGYTLLDLRGLRLYTLPDVMGQLTLLRKLWVSNNQLVSLPEAIGKLRALIELDAANNRLMSLPENIARLTRLETLSLDNNALMELPQQIDHLASLRALHVSDNVLSFLPDGICGLSCLEYLSANANTMTYLPEHIGQLKLLQRIELNDNRLTALPASFSQMKNLEEAYLSDNQLTALPVDIGQLRRLQNLYVVGNQLTFLPDSIGRLVALRELDVARNRLLQLPRSLAQLREHVALDLRDNPAARVVGILHWLYANGLYVTV